MLRWLPVVLALAVAAAEGAHLAIGAPAPEFSLPGIDGKSHALRDYADSRALAIVFTGNSCPVSQQYEARIRKLHEDYRDKGVSVVAINPNAPAAMQLADLGYSDVGETLDDMKARAADRQLQPLSLGRPGSGGLERSSASSRCHTSSSSIRRARCGTRA